MTEKLYYADSLCSSFSARVTACAEEKGRWLIALDKTAFFPEGGGQPADTGRIGSSRVFDAHERAGEVWHYADTPLTVGEEYDCEIDFEKRLRRMQNHSGEHIFSGLVHSAVNADNAGFHMGADCMTVDFNAELSFQALAEIETRANEVVRQNLPILTYFPESDALGEISYRSKLELTENVRLVEIPGVDLCACCAPHLKSTGAVGLIKVLDAVRHRGGVRVSLVCGMDALDAVRDAQKNVTEASRLLSAKRNELSSAVERVLAQEQSLKERIAALGLAYAALIARNTAPREGNICVFDNALDEVALRELVNLLSEKCTGCAAAFSGDDEHGYKYIIGSRNIDLRKASKEINAALSGRGGGRAEMIEGRAAKPAKEIQDFLENQFQPTGDIRLNSVDFRQNS